MLEKEVAAVGAGPAGAAGVGMEIPAASISAFTFQKSVRGARIGRELMMLILKYYKNSALGPRPYLVLDEDSGGRGNERVDDPVDPEPRGHVEREEAKHDGQVLQNLLRRRLRLVLVLKVYAHISCGPRV